MTRISQDDTKECTEPRLVLDQDETRPIYTCQHCQCASEFSDGFQKTKSYSRHEDQYICISCTAHQNSSKSNASNFIDLLIWFTILSFFVYSDGATQVLSFLITWFFILHLAIFVHELGHYIASLLAGVNVRLLMLGSGPTLKVFRFKQLFIVLKLFPFSGSVHPDFDSANGIRGKFFFIVAAGPLFNLFMAAFTAFTLIYSNVALSPFVSDLLWFWLFVNVSLGILNLIPGKSTKGLGHFLSDGAQLISIPSWTDEDIKKLVRMNQGILAQLEYEHGDKAVARAIATAAIESGQDAQIHSLILTVSARTKQEFELAIKLNRQVLEGVDKDDEITAVIRNNLAYSLFKHGEAALLPEADRQSLKAMEMLPMVLAVRSTRGSVLVALGQFEAGLELLEDERFSIETKENQATVLRTRSQAYQQLGRFKEANLARETANQLDPGFSLTKERQENSVETITKVF